MDMQTQTPNVNLEALAAQMNRIEEQLDFLVQRQRYQSELIDEMWPIMNEVVKASTETLNDLEKKGYFAFARQGIRLVERVVEGFGEDDVAQLGDSIVSILETVRGLTQPEVLAVANEAGEVLSHTEDVEPVGVLGMVKASRDADVQHGMAVMVEVLRHIGRAGRTTAVRRSTAAKRKDRLNAKLRSTRTRTPTERPAARTAKAAGPSCAAPSDNEGAVADWTRDMAQALAAADGVALTDAHWTLIDYARAQYAEHGTAPNIRKLTTGLGVTTKDVYALFPKAPARTLARVAGLPKPAGCI